MLTAPSSFFNQPLPADVPIDPSSAAYVASMLAQLPAEPANPALEIRNFAYTLWYAGPDTPTRKVWLDVSDASRAPGGVNAEKQKMLEAVPVPPTLRPPGPFTGNEDNPAAIYQPSTDKFWEAAGWRLKGVDTMRTAEEVPGCSTLNEPGWHVLAAAAVEHFSQSPGYSQTSDWPGQGKQLWGISGSGIFGAAGVIQPHEGKRRYIPHAIRIEGVHAKIAAKESEGGTGFRWPAQRTDGAAKAEGPEAVPNAVQSGMIFTVPKSIPLAAIKAANPFAWAVCVAVRDYGFIITDGASTPSIKCAREDTMANSQTFGYDDWLGPEGKANGKGILTASSGVTAREIWNTIGPYLQVVDASYRPSSIAPGNLLGVNPAAP